jgi:uncharacterized protein YkwD
MRVVIRTAAVILIAFASVAIPSAQAQSGTGTNAAELELLASVNRTRKAQGLPGLKWSDALATAARKHAAVMAQHGTAGHGYSGEPSMAARATQAGAKFSWLAENVCQGARVEAVDEEFLNSPKHRANILDSDMDSIGIGVVERAGQLYAVEDFSKAK